MIAQLLNGLGVYAGQPDELTPGDMFNPTGFWELADVVKLDKEILEALGGDAMNCALVDTARLLAEARGAFLARARAATEPLRGRGPYLLKAPRLSLLVPFWREALGGPVCVIVWRHPLAVARSLRTRERRPVISSLALWDHYNRTLLRDTEGLARLLVSYEEFLSDPARVARELRDRLAGFGIDGLALPDEAELRQIANADFNRSGGSADDEETLLDDSQRSLLVALRSGEALRELVAPTARRTLDLIAELEMAGAEILGLLQKVEKLWRGVEARDQLIRTIFASRSWRAGHGLTGIVRQFTRPMRFRPSSSGRR